MSQIDALFYDFFNEKGREPNNGSELSKYINEKEIEKKRSEAPSIELLNFFEMCASEKEKELRVKGKDITRNNISNTYRQTAKLLLPVWLLTNSYFFSFTVNCLPFELFLIKTSWIIPAFLQISLIFRLNTTLL